MLLVLCPTHLIASDKSDGIKPHWVTHQIPDSKSETYIFERAYGEGRSLEIARQQCLKNLSMRLERERHVSLNTSSTNSEVCRTIDEYWTETDGIYRLYVLYTIPKYMLPGFKGKLGSSFDDEIKVTTNYGARGFYSIVPGVAQFHKGSTLKGVTFLSSEIASVIGVIVCENTRASYRNKAVEQPKYMKEYSERADNWETARNICIGVGGAIYVWNLVDAFVAKGGKRVIVKKHNTQLSVTPITTPTNVGVHFALNF